MKALLQSKIHHPGVWHATGYCQPKVIRTGRTDFDACLPAGGWQSEVIYEVANNHQHAFLTLLQPALLQLSETQQWLLLLNPPRWFLEQLNQDCPSLIEHVLVVHGKAEFDTLWATEQALRQSNSACVLAWPEQMNTRDIQRLKLAARKSQSLCFMFPSEHDSSAPACQLQCIEHRAQLQPSVVHLREQVAANCSACEPLH